MKIKAVTNEQVHNKHDGLDKENGRSDTVYNGDTPKLDAGALFVLESKGTWVHAGFHLTTSIVAPALLSFPYAFAGLGWGPGILALVAGAAVTFYAYNLISKVLEFAELQGHRSLRFRDLGSHVLGRKWGLFFIAPIQVVVCIGAVIGAALLGGQSMKIIYYIYKPQGPVQLYVFIIAFGVLMMLLSQLPSFHSLRYINLASLLLCLAYSLCVVAGSIYAGHSREAPPKDYSLLGSRTTKLFGAFNSLAVIATIYGNGIIPEIQATLAPPVSGKMFKGLSISYAVVLSTFFPVACSGYWAFGNQSQGNIFSNLVPSGSVSLIPNWLTFMANIFVIAQLFAVALVYSQPTFEIFESRSSDVAHGKFSLRNLVPRLIVRSLFVAVATLIAAAFPFFGDINAIIGAFGFIPLDFVLPFVLYTVTFRPSPRSIIFWVNYLIIFVYTVVGVVGCIAAVRQVVLDASKYQLFANV